MNIQQYIVGPVQTNCYLLGDESTRAAAFIDPGESGAQLARLADEGGWSVTAVLLTHGHFDHIAGVAALLRGLKSAHPTSRCRCTSTGPTTPWPPPALAGA